jgi:hypothetical protein
MKHIITLCVLKAEFLNLKYVVYIVTTSHYNVKTQEAVRSGNGSKCVRQVPVRIWALLSLLRSSWLSSVYRGSCQGNSRETQ